MRISRILKILELRIFTNFGTACVASGPVYTCCGGLSADKPSTMFMKLLGVLLIIEVSKYSLLLFLQCIHVEVSVLQ